MLRKFQCVCVSVSESEREKVNVGGFNLWCCLNFSTENMLWLLNSIHISIDPMDVW